MTDINDDIAELRRAYVYQPNRHIGSGNRDRVRRVLDEVDRLTKELANTKQACGIIGGASRENLTLAQNALAERDKLRGEVERLRGLACEWCAYKLPLVDGRHIDENGNKFDCEAEDAQ
jgi:hypothetical protein